MSRSSKKIGKYNNLKTSSGRFVTKRVTRVFDSATTVSAADSVLLYRLVFKSKKAAMTAILLCLCFTTQSVKFAEANEDTDGAASEEVAAEEVVVEEVSVKSIDEPDVPEESDVVMLDNESDDNSEQTTETPESQSNAESESLVGDDVVPDATTTAQAEEHVETETESVTSTSETDSVTASTTQTSVPSTATTTIDTGSSTPTNDAYDAATTTATEVSSSTGSTTNQSATDSDASGTSNEDEIENNSSPDSEDSSGDGQSESEDESEDDDYVKEAPTTSNENLVFTMESDTHFSFDKNECTRIEDGTFYCQEQDTSDVLEDSLIAAPDSEGDLEIFLVREGERYQITHNEVDDASPYFDELSNTIVWHRLLNDRYQIISYDIESGEEQQLTQTSVNNMEPARHGEYTVWQRWVENNWEVILYDGAEKVQITQSARHDIAPHIRGPLVIWNSQSNDGSQELRTFDIQSRTQTTIADSEGVSVSNPRMVVMYEAMYENGDIVTKGFDLVSGKVVPLQALPKQLPDELPNSEPTEEVRALIQSKPEPKGTTVSNVQNSTGTSTGTSTTAAVPNATSSPETLDLRSLSTPELIEHLTKTDAATASAPDMHVENESAATTTQNEAQAEIPDLIIPVASSTTQEATSTQNTQE